jgi:hypothetical protein
MSATTSSLTELTRISRSEAISAASLALIDPGGYRPRQTIASRSLSADRSGLADRGAGGSDGGSDSRTVASSSETRLMASAAADIATSAAVPVGEDLLTMRAYLLLGRMRFTPQTVLGIGAALNAPSVDGRRSLGVGAPTPSVTVAP